MTDQNIQENQIPAETTETEDDAFASNYALAIAFALPIGMLLGLLVFDNIALGSAFGLALSPAIALFMKNRKSEE